MKRFFVCIFAFAACAAPRNPDVEPPRVRAEHRAEAPPPRVDAADTAVPRELTLERAVELARATHPALAAARARAAAAAARLDGAGRMPNPDAVLRAESVGLEGSSMDSAEFLAGISQPVPLGGRRSAEERVAEADLRSAELGVETAGLEVLAAVRGAFATALYAQHAVELRAELFEQSRGLESLLAARLRRGDVTQESVLLAELVTLDAQHELERAESLFASARGELALAVGVPTNRIESVMGQLEETLALPALEELLARIDQDPRILGARADADAAAARIELASAERIPDLRFELLYRRIEGDDRNAVDLGVSMPLPLFQDGRPRVDEARARAAEVRALERGAALRLESVARVAHERLAHAWADLERIDGEVLPREETLLAMRERRFEAGDSGLAEVLAARARAGHARLERLEALRAALVAWTDLAPLLTEPDRTGMAAGE